MTLPGAEPYPNTASLPLRFTRHAFTAAQARTLRSIRKYAINSDELERYVHLHRILRWMPGSRYSRISQLEMLDEVEELDLVLEHYAITWGYKLYEHEHSAQWGGWGLTQLPKTPDC